MSSRILCAAAGLTALGLLSVPLARALPGRAALRPLVTPAPAAPSAPADYPIFTVRYVCFVATPKVAMTKAQAQADDPPLFEELNGGSTRAMDTSPEGFLNKLRGADQDYRFQALLSGTVPCVNNGQQPAVIEAGPDLTSGYRAVLKDSLFLSQNSPTRLTLHHTGNFVYTQSASTRGGPGWLNTRTDKLMIGRVYTQGCDYLSDGRKIAYAFCVLPGNLDGVASAWSGKGSHLGKRAVAATGYAGYVGHEFIPHGDPLAALAAAHRLCAVG